MNVGTDDHVHNNLFLKSKFSRLIVIFYNVRNPHCVLFCLIQTLTRDQNNWNIEWLYKLVFFFFFADEVAGFKNFFYSTNKMSIYGYLFASFSGIGGG